MPSSSQARREQLLERALSVFLAWRDAGEPPDPASLLSAHPELCEFLEPLLGQPAPIPAPGVIQAATLGDFRLVREIGRGGMGVVHEAVQLSLGRRVALKVLPPVSALSSTALARFLAEAELAARLDHPGIVRMLARGETDGTHWLAMELVEGASLERLLEPARAIGIDRLDRTNLAGVLAPVLVPGAEPRGWVEFVAGAIAQVAEGLHHGHGSGVVHRDVKPANILIRRGGDAVLTDFGLARDLGTPALTRSGAVAGTPFYMSPEQARGDRVVDARSDVFSLGATLYEALTLVRPFPGDTTAAVIHQILTREPPEPDRLNPRLPGDLVAVVLRALEKEPSRRYASAAEFAADLRAFLASRPVLARRVTLVRRALRWARRERLKAALAAALLLAVPAITGLAGYLLAAAPVIRAGAAKLQRDRIEQLLAEGLPLAIEGNGDGVPLFREALALDPASCDAPTGLVLCLRDQERRSELTALLDASAGQEGAARVARRLRAHVLGLDGGSMAASAALAELGAPRDLNELFVEAVTTGKRAERQGPEQFALALRLFKRVIERSPRARLAYHSQWAHLAGHLGDRDEISRATQALEELWPDSGQAWFWIGFAWLHTDPARAAVALRRARALAPTSRRLLMDVAFAEAGCGNHAAAVAAYRELLRGLPEDRSAWFGLGITLLQAQAPTEAAEAFRRLIQLEPDHQLAQYNLGVALGECGDAAGALEQYRIAVRLDPNHPESRVNLGNNLLDLNRDEEARGELLEAVRIAPHLEPAHHNLMVALRRLGRTEEMAQEQERWTRRTGHPGSGPASRPATSR